MYTLSEIFKKDLITTSYAKVLGETFFHNLHSIFCKRLLRHIYNEK